MANFIKLTEAIFDKVTDFDKGYAKVTTIQYLDDEGKLTQREYAKSIKNDTKILDIDLKLHDENSTELKRSNNPVEKKENNHLIIFNENNKFGYKNVEGQIVIEANFDIANEFINGFAKVGKKKDFGKNRSLTYWGIIDEDGELALPCNYKNLGNVYNNIVWYEENKLVSYMHYNFSDYVLKEYTIPKFGFLIYKNE